MSKSSKDPNDGGVNNNSDTSIASSLSPESSTELHDSCSPPPQTSGGFETTATKSQQREDGPRALLDFNVQVAAVALAQLSLAPRTEYVGSGTVLCAIHKVSDPCQSSIIQRLISPAVPLSVH